MSGPKLMVNIHVNGEVRSSVFPIQNGPPSRKDSRNDTSYLQ
jgi:hypothetical protein